MAFSPRPTPSRSSTLREKLERLIEETLGVEATTIGFGICVAFRSEEEAELFEARRNTRRIDWTEIGAQLRFSAPAKRERRSLDRYP